MAIRPSGCFPAMNDAKNEHAGCRRMLLLIVSLFAGVMALQKVYDYDVWWHLRTGQWIVENRALPTGDPFSFATAEAPWTLAYWLSDPLYYLVAAAAGIEGLQLFSALIVAGAVLFLCLFLTEKRLPAIAAAGLAAWVVTLARFRFILRPLVFKFAGVVFLFWYFFGGPERRRRYLLFFLVVLLWNGLYPAAFLAQLFAGLFLLEKLAEHVFKSDRYAPGDLRNALILLGLASAALLVNPSGLDLYRLVYGGMFADYGAGITLVEEQQALVWTAHPGFAALAALSAATFWFGRRRLRLLTPMVFVLFLVLAAGSVRFIGVASFALAAVIGVNLAECSWPSWLTFRGARRRWPGLLAAAGLAAVCLALWQATFQKTRGYEFGLGVKPGRFPEGAVQQLKAAGFAGNLYNSWKFGGYLQWRLPEARTFIDGRCLPDQLALYERFKTIDRHEFARYLTANQVQAAVLDRQDLRDIDYFNDMPGFRQAAADDISVLFVRSDLPLGAGAASSGGYRYLRPGGYDFDYLAPLATGPEAAEVEAELRRAVAGAPDGFFENFRLAFFLDARNDPAAAAQYLLAARKNPAFAVTHFGIGVRGGKAALRAGQWAVAVELATLALEYQQTGEHYFFLGAAQQQLRQYPAAEKAYRASLDLAENGRVRNNLGFLLLETGQAGAARAVFAKGLEERRGADREQSLFGLVLAAAGLRDDQAAKAARQRLADEFPGSPYLARLAAERP